MRYLYIIPARGGSKGIPHKNIKPLAGRSLVARAIDRARAAGARDEDICLSTDSAEIRAEGEALGLEVPFLRPAELARDTSGSREVMLHAFDFYSRLRGPYDAIVLLQPTSPFCSPGDVEAARSLYTPDVDMVVTVTEAATNPYYNAFELADDGTLHISKGEGLYTRRQDAPKVWEYNGAVYVINPQSLKQMPMGAFPRRLPCVMPRERSLDIDTPADWLVAEQILSQENE